MFENYNHVLAIGAHPDDIEPQSGGTLAKISQAGCEVSIVIATATDTGADFNTRSIERENNRQREAIPFDGTAISMPHLGGVEIQEDCVIGSNCTIASGTIFPTIISKNVRTDDQVHIGHNCQIGDGTVITAQSEISGSVIVERNCWIGPSCSVTQKVIIGERSLIGIGSNVTRDVAPGSVQMGNPAKKLRDNK